MAVQRACQRRYGARMRIASTTRLDLSMVGVLVATAIVAGRGTPGVELPTTRDLQVAVLRNGFAFLDGTPTARTVTSVNRDGGSPKSRSIPVTAEEARLVGTSSGVAIGWLATGKVHLARVNADGELGRTTEWGKRVKQLCRGNIRDETQYGLGWMETDGSVWVVYGSLKQATAVSPPEQGVTSTRNIWCEVTGAGKKFLLVWSDHRHRVEMSLCDKKGCTLSSPVPVAKTSRLEGIACNDERCVAVARDQRGDATLGWFTLPHGKLVWSKPLADATRDTTFSLVAAGPSAFAVGYVTREGATAVRVIEGGSMVRAWADPYAHEPPALAWAQDRLFVAHRHDGAVAPEVVPLPR